MFPVIELLSRCKTMVNCSITKLVRAIDLVRKEDNQTILTNSNVNYS